MSLFILDWSLLLWFISNFLDFFILIPSAFYFFCKVYLLLFVFFELSLILLWFLIDKGKNRELLVKSQLFTSNFNLFVSHNGRVVLLVVEECLFFFILTCVLFITLRNIGRLKNNLLFWLLLLHLFLSIFVK